MKVNIITENGLGNTIESLSEISDYQEYILDIKNSNKTGVDTDYFLQKPQKVAVKNIYDKEVRKILGNNADGIIKHIKGMVKLHQCHKNAALAGGTISSGTNWKCKVYYCGGTLGYANNIVVDSLSHCILYIERNGKGVFIDPTQFLIGCLDTFNLFYFAPLEHIIYDLFNKYEQTFNPLFGYYMDLHETKLSA